MWVFCCDCSLIWDRVKSGRIFFPLIYWKLQWLSFALTYFLSALFRVCSEQGFLFLYFCRFCSLLLLFYFIFNLLLEVRLKSSHNISDTHSFKARDGGTWKRVRVTQDDVHMRTKPGFSSSPPGCCQICSLEPQSSFSSKPIPSAGFLSCCLPEDPTAWKLASEMASLVNKQHSGQLRARLLCLWKMRKVGDSHSDGRWPQGQPSPHSEMSSWCRMGCAAQSEFVSSSECLGRNQMTCSLRLSLCLIRRLSQIWNGATLKCVNWS